MCPPPAVSESVWYSGKSSPWSVFLATSGRDSQSSSRHEKTHARLFGLISCTGSSQTGHMFKSTAWKHTADPLHCWGWIRDTAFYSAASTLLVTCRDRSRFIAHQIIRHLSQRHWTVDVSFAQHGSRFALRRRIYFFNGCFSSWSCRLDSNPSSAQGLKEFAIKRTRWRVC